MPVTHGEGLRTKFLLLKGPRGSISQRCTSLALQSFMSTRPKTWSLAALVVMASPCLLPGPMKHA